MDKKSLSLFGFTAISVILFIIMINMVIPMGKTVKEDTDTKVYKLLNSAYTFTETVNNKETYTLTIKYLDAANNVISTYTANFKDGEKYYIASPEIKGQKPDCDVISGTITNDAYYEVHYSASLD